MSQVVADSGIPRTLKDRALKQKLQLLRATDNFTNLLFLGRAYLILAVAIIGAVWFHQWQQVSGVSFWWNVPVFAAAVIAVGASQHQLAGATHEATHHILFKNRLLNELASDWLCMFPLFSSTYVFRLHHLAHHQFINDPERDPDFSQLRTSGHWLKFPVSKGQFLWKLVRQIALLPLFLYILVRAKYNAIGVTNNPYYDPKRPHSRWPERLIILHLALSLAGHFILWRHLSTTQLLLIVSVGLPLVMIAVLTLIPSKRFFIARLRPIVPPKVTVISRLIHVTLAFAAFSMIEGWTGIRAWRYFFLLWVLPIFTTFAFFMILRQLVQHGNGDRGRLTNTRVFLVNPFIRYAVFPFGMDYHLPHHVYASIPHHRLPELHNYLMQCPEYRERGIVVEGYFVPTSKEEPRNPTVLEVLGPDYAQHSEEVFVDASVVEGMIQEESVVDDATNSVGSSGDADKLAG